VQTQDAQKARAVGLLDEVRTAVMEEAESRIEERLKQLWSQAAAEVKKHQSEWEGSMNELLQEAKSLTARQQSMQAENQALMVMLNSWMTHVLPDEGKSKELSVLGGDSPSTATTAHESSGSSEGSPGGLSMPENLDMPEQEMLEIPPFPGCAVHGGHVPCVCPPPGLAPWPSSLPALSLADALGIAPEANRKADEEVDAFVFKLTLRVADDMDLGLCFTKKGEVLRIDKVKSGAAESWNRQCSTSGSPERVLSPGDLVISVNDHSDPEIMLQECESNKLLKLRVLRREVKDNKEVSKPWDTVHVQYPLTFPTGLGYGHPGDWMTFPWAQR